MSSITFIREVRYIMEVTKEEFIKKYKNFDNEKIEKLWSALLESEKDGDLKDSSDEYWEDFDDEGVLDDFVDAVDDE